jgi:hypothetical protein
LATLSTDRVAKPVTQEDTAMAMEAVAVDKDAAVVAVEGPTKDAAATNQERCTSPRLSDL